MTKQEISDLFDRYEDGYQAWRGNGVMTKGAFIEAVTEALRIHDVVGQSEQLLAYTEWLKKQGLLNATVSKLIVKKYIGK